MISWNVFWQVLVIASITSFAGLSLYIVIAGFRDVLTMFRRIETQHEQESVECQPDEPT